LTLEEILGKTPIKYHWLFDDKAFQKWIQKKLDYNPDITNSSMQEYIPKIAEFLNFSGIKYSSVLVQKIKESEDLGRWRDLLDSWFRKLTSKDGQTRKYGRDKLLVVLDFLGKHDISLSYRLPGLGRSKSAASQFRLTFDILRDAFLAVPPRDPMRFLITLMKDSGLSGIDILDLDVDYAHYDEINHIQYPSIRAQLQEGKEFVTIARNRSKSGARETPIVSFFGPETKTLFQFDDRNHKLFPNWTTTRGMQIPFKRLQAKLNQPYLVLRTIRSLFDTTIEASGINPDMAEIMMGHEIPDKVRRAYLRFGDKHLRPKYEEIYDELRLFPRGLEARIPTLTMDEWRALDASLPPRPQEGPSLLEKNQAEPP
ncbi:MAG: hypothetical protein ACRECH_17375, partial [Nitrososphaerales archaeon]